MPPSPQPDFGTSTKPSLRRATSLPPEQSRFSGPSTPVIPYLKLPDSEDLQPDDDDSVEIEELSPEAIIPDEIPVLRDPEIEVPDEEGTAEAELEEKFTTILNLDRMHDGSEDGNYDEEGEYEEERPAIPVPNRRKRKFTPGEEGRDDEPLRKRAVSPRTISSPLRRG